MNQDKLDGPYALATDERTPDEERRNATVLCMKDKTMNRITSNPEICGDMPCIRGMGIPVSLVLKHLAAGRTSEQIVDEFPQLELEDIAACIDTQKAGTND